MIEGRPFLYQSLDGIVYHVNERGVQPIQSPWSPENVIVAFVDADKKDHEPNSILFDDDVQIIMVSSPNGANTSWIDQANGQVEILIAKLWSPRELFLTGFVL